MQAVIPEAVTLYIPRRVAAAVRRSRESRKLHGILVTKRIVVGVVSTLGIELSDGPHTIDSGQPMETSCQWCVFLLLFCYELSWP